MFLHMYAYLFLPSLQRGKEIATTMMSIRPTRLRVATLLVCARCRGPELFYWRVWFECNHSRSSTVVLAFIWSYLTHGIVLGRRKALHKHKLAAHGIPVSNMPLHHNPLNMSLHKHDRLLNVTFPTHAFADHAPPPYSDKRRRARGEVPGREVHLRLLLWPYRLFRAARARTTLTRATAQRYRAMAVT